MEIKKKYLTIILGIIIIGVLFFFNYLERKENLKKWCITNAISEDKFKDYLNDRRIEIYQQYLKETIEKCIKFFDY